MDKFTIPPGYPGKCTPDKLRRMAADLAASQQFLDEFKAAKERTEQRKAAYPHTADHANAADREQLRRYFCDLLYIDSPPSNGDQFAGDAALLFWADPPRWADTPRAKKVVITKPPSLKELIETKLGPNPDPMQDFRNHAARQMLDAMQSMRKLLDEGGVPVQNPVFCVPAPWRDDILSSPEFGHIDSFRFISTSPTHQYLPKKETTMNTKPLTITTKTFTYVNGVDVNNYSASELYDMIAREESKIRALEAIDHKPVMLQQEIARRKDGIAALVAHLDAVTVVPTPTPVVTDTDVSNAPATGL